MQINTNGKRNITLDFDAPKKFKLKKDGAEIPYIRTGKNSFRLGRNIDGVLDLEEIIEQPRYMQPVQLQPQQMTVINPQDVERLNEAVRQMALVNPQDVMIINQTAEQLEKNQNFIAQTQKEITDNQVYIDQQQQRLNETALGIQALETDNSQRLDGAENAILNLAGEISNAQNMAVDGINTVSNKIEEQGVLLQAEIDTKADKDELETLRKDFEEKSDQFSNAMSNYSGGTAYDTLPQGGEAGQILAKRTDRQGDYIWINQTPVIVKSETIPTASEKYKGEVYQYVGETGEYTHGYIYECQQNGTSYEWVRLDVQPNTAVWGQITGTLSDQTDLQEAFDDKQDKLTQTQMDAVNSGANQSNIAQISTNQTNINTINSKIPSQASSSNQLADKSYVDTADNGKQDTLVSGTNIKTVNNTSLLGSGNVAVQETLVSGTNIKTVNGSSLLGSGNLTTSAQWGGITGTLSNQTDLQNALDAKQDTATAVNYDNITNCITEIPQDIKLELNNGTLTLKAGSKVYVPNGFEADGTTPRFNVVNIASDVSLNYTYTPPSDSKVMVFINRNGTGFVYSRLENACYSGTTQPSGNYRNWYNTDENKMYSIGNGAIDGSGFSFPIATIIQGSNGITKSIDQVFNGFGYIGSTVFALPGVKGLIPNGRNADGSLKNIEFTIDTVKITTFPNVVNQNHINMGITANTDIDMQFLTYNEKENLIYNGRAQKVLESNIATLDVQNGRITSFTSKTAFHAVDYNDFSNLKDTVDTNDLDVVHKTGNETISGEKITTAKIEMQSTNGSTSPVLLFHIPNVRYTRLIETSNGLEVQEGGGSSLDRLYAGASDANNTVITTINKSKNTNGYFQLGNGLIVNWGRTSNTQQTNVTFSKAYSSADSYAVIAVPYTSSNSNQDGYSCYVTNLSATGCTIWNKMYGSSISAIKHWIAIGY